MTLISSLLPLATQLVPSYLLHSEANNTLLAKKQEAGPDDFTRFLLAPSHDTSLAEQNLA